MYTVQVLRKHLLAMIGMCMLILSVGITDAQTAAWMRKTVVLKAEKAALPALIARFADETGQSVVIEGRPLAKLVDLDVQKTAAEALTDISKAFDYDWTISKSGVILLTKRFTTRQDMPEFTVPELKAVAQDVCDVVRAVYPLQGTNPGIHKMFPILTKSLNPAQRKILTDGKKLQISSLSKEQQLLVAQIVYTELLEKLLKSWERLHDGLQALPNASVYRVQQKFGQGALSEDRLETYLTLSNKDGTEAVFELYGRRVGDKSGEASIEVGNDEDIAAVPSTSGEMPGVKRRSSDVSLGLCALQKAIAALQERSGGTILLDPALAQRHVILEARNASVPQILSALAELQDLALTKLDANKYTLLRREYLRPQKVQELGTVIKVVLPPDLRRFLLADPEAKPREKRVDDLPLPAYKTYFIAHRANARFVEMYDTERTRLYHSLLLDKRLSEQRVFFPHLSPQQQERCVRILALRACDYSVLELTPLMNKLTTYQENPSSAYLRYDNPRMERNGGFILIGGELKPDQQGGEFGVPLWLVPAEPDTLPPVSAP